MSLAELMSSSIIFWDTTRALTCMFLTSRLSSLFWKLVHAFRIRWFCERYTSVTWFACLFHVFFVCWRTFQTSESLLDLDHTNEVRGLQLYEASCVSRRILQNLRKSSFRSSRRNWNFMRHSHEKSRRGQNSGLNCSISFPWHCRIHSSMLSISSFVFATGNVWNVNWIAFLSIIFTMSLLYSRCPFHLSVDLVPYDIIEYFPDIEESLRRRELLSRVFSTTRCRFDQFSH